MKIKTGKYMFLGNINALFGPGLKYADTLTGLKLKAGDKYDIGRGEAALFAVRDNKVVRIATNGKVW